VEPASKTPGNEDKKSYARCGIEGLFKDPPSPNWPRGRPASGEVAMVNIEKALGCPVDKAGRFGVERLHGTFNLKKDMFNGIKAIFKIGDKLADMLKWGERTFPSDNCCNNIPNLRDFVSFGWTTPVLERCCAKKNTPRAKCNPRKPSTCIKLVRITHKIELGRSTPAKKKKMQSQKFKCLAREPSSGGMFPKAHFEEEEEGELGEMVEWGRRRRRRRRRSCGWVCRKARKLKKHAKKAVKHVKKAAKKIKKAANKAVKAVKKGLKKLGKFVGSRIIKKVIKLILKLVPRKLRPGFAKMLPYIVKGKIKKAIVAGAKMITGIVSKLVPKKFRKVVKIILPYALKGKTKAGVMKILRHVRSLFLEDFMASSAQTPLLFFECSVKSFAIPLVDFDYVVDLEWTKEQSKIRGPGCCSTGPDNPSNLLDSRKGCKGTGSAKHGSLGPFVLKVTRKLKVGSAKKAVCHFTFTGDSFRCKNAPKNCCSNWAYSQPRFTTTDYQPQLQVKNHNCKVASSPLSHTHNTASRAPRGGCENHVADLQSFCCHLP
jgi:hypothetical protein